MSGRSIGFQTAVLCGGLGSRLGDLTRSTPKPLLQVGGEPFLEHLVRNITLQGGKKILLLAGYLSDQIREFAERSPTVKKYGLEVSISVDPGPVGTGGALWHASALLDDRFALLNGDSWFDVSFGDLAASLNEPLEGVIALREVDDASRYGVVRLEGDVVTAFASRPDTPGPGLVNGGIYVLRKSILNSLSPSCSLERDLFPRLAAERRLGGRTFQGYFIDIGVPASLRQAETDFTQSPIASIER